MVVDQQQQVQTREPHVQWPIYAEMLHHALNNTSCGLGGA
jgi:hypothetical protein